MSFDGHPSDQDREVVNSIEENYGSDGSPGRVLIRRKSSSRPASDLDRSTDSTGDPSDDRPGLDDDQLDDGGALFQVYAPPSQQPVSEDSEYATNGGESDISFASNESGNVPGQIRLGQRRQSRKRKSPIDEPNPCSTDGAVDSRPRKRVTGALNRAYLDLLNEDIMHAVSQCVPLVAGHQDDKRIDLPTSQIGMTVWSAMEKERFFEALGRLGRDDASGIARRIRTKGELEVRQYMKLLQDSIAQRQQLDELPPLALADFPAATELSHECCQALEEAADSLAARQDRIDTTVEEDKHGARWLVTQDTYKQMTGNVTEDDLQETSNLFNIPKWLMLSERFFMNAPSGEGNWQAVNGDVPSIWLTTLNDFRSLALILTRRLVAATLFTANSRVRAERGSRSNIEHSVKDKDVHAAALSLGLSTQKPCLMKSVRNLGLHVYDEPPKPNEEVGTEPLSHEAIEDALAGIEIRRSVSRVRRRIERIAYSSDGSSISSDSSGQSGTDTEAEQSGGSTSDKADGEEDEDVVAEAQEAILYCALDPPQTKRDRQALYRRIKAEREQEAHADAVDAQASYQEEKLLWEMLGKGPLKPLTDPGAPARLRRLSTKQSVDAGYAVGKQWRAKTKRISEWEAQYQRALN